VSTGPSIAQVRQLLASGGAAQAVEIARRMVFQAPNSGECLALLADALAVCGVLDQAAHYYERAIKQLPEAVAVRNNFGFLLMQRNQLDRAIAELSEALRVQPAYAGAACNLIMALTSARRTMDAVDVARKTLALAPADDALARNAGIAMLSAGLADEAVTVLERIRAGGVPSPALLAVLAHAMNYAPGLDPKAIAAVHAELGRRLAAAFPADAAPDTGRSDARPLRIGYLSSAFCDHSAGHFLESLLAHHDRERFQIYCYSNLAKEDELTARVKPMAAAWVDSRRLTPRALADRIRADRIDIALDLQGHTATTMLPALCFRAAPVQATYLGYPNTTGVPAIDYRLVDALTDPPGAEPLSTEMLVRLDPCFLCYAPPPHAPEPACEPPCVAAGAITFGSFNSNGKLSASTLETWAGVLRAVPGSRLILKNMILADASVAAFRRGQFSRLGIDPARIELLGETPGRTDHMAMYDRIDIALDPFPYNGTTTTVEALWMGVPVVALAGDSHVSRVSVSLLSVAGVPELIAASRKEYIRIASGLAGDAGRLRALRRSLRDQLRGSALCDAAGFTRRLEAAYLDMIRRRR
jgi:protein O-GlcNAc transferase